MLLTEEARASDESDGRGRRRPARAGRRPTTDRRARLRGGAAQAAFHPGGPPHGRGAWGGVVATGVGLRTRRAGDQAGPRGLPREAGDEEAPKAAPEGRLPAGEGGSRPRPARALRPRPPTSGSASTARSSTPSSRCAKRTGSRRWTRSAVSPPSTWWWRSGWPRTCIRSSRSTSPPSTGPAARTRRSGRSRGPGSATRPSWSGPSREPCGSSRGERHGVGQQHHLPGQRERRDRRGSGSGTHRAGDPRRRRSLAGGHRAQGGGPGRTGPEPQARPRRDPGRHLLAHEPGRARHHGGAPGHPEGNRGHPGHRGHREAGGGRRPTRNRSRRIAIRKRSIFSLGYDHRIVDGADAARFLARLKEIMESFPENA
jgi:hypothetical protein